MSNNIDLEPFLKGNVSDVVLLTENMRRQHVFNVVAEFPSLMIVAMQYGNLHLSERGFSVKSRPAKIGSIDINDSVARSMAISDTTVSTIYENDEKLEEELDAIRKVITKWLS